MKIKLAAEFEVAIHQNATNIAIALAQAGRYVRIRQDNSRFVVEVWEIDYQNKKK